MANPNKTVEAYAKRRPFDPEKQAAQDAARVARTDEFMTWLMAQGVAGKSFQTVEEARAAYDAEHAGGGSGEAVGVVS